MKTTDFKIWSFLTKNPALTPCKKVDFWTKYKYSFKSFQSNQCVRKHTLTQLLGLPSDQRKGKSPLKMKSGSELNRKFFVRALFALKIDSQGSFTTRKIWSFLAKNHGLTPWQKVDFWTKYKYSFKSFQSNQCVHKRPLRHFLGSQGSFTTRRDP